MMRRFTIGILALAMLITSHMAEAAVKPILSANAVAELERKGHRMSDIRAAEVLTVLYGTEPTKYLDSVKLGKSWMEIVHTERLRAKSEGRMLPTYTRLTGDDAVALLDRGYGYDDIIIADLVAHRFNLPVDEVLVAQRGRVWVATVEALFSLEQQLRPITPGTPPVWANDVFGQLKGRVPIDLITSMAARGLNQNDVVTADSLAAKFGRPIAFVAMLKSPEQHWGVGGALLEELARYGK